MTSLLAITAPVFGLILAGWASTFTKVLDPATGRILAGFVYWIAIPCLLVRGLSRIVLPPELPLGYLATYLAGVGITFVLSMAIAWARGERKVDRLGITGFGSAFGNGLLVGTPIILAAFGDAAALPLFLTIAFDGFFLFVAVIVVVELGRGGRAGLRRLPRTIAVRLGSNPVLMATIVGMALALAGLRLPAPVDRFTELMGAAAVPCALFATGAGLRQYRLQGALGSAVQMTLLKLLVQPAIIWTLGSLLLDLPRPWVAVATLFSAMPVGVNAYIFATRYEAGQAETAAAILMSTVLAVVSLTLLVGLLT
jgi:malonate transporter